MVWPTQSKSITLSELLYSVINTGTIDTFDKAGTAVSLTKYLFTIPSPFFFMMVANTV
jgi:hypothetical protein